MFPYEGALTSVLVDNFTVKLAFVGHCCIAMCRVESGLGAHTSRMYLGPLGLE